MPLSFRVARVFSANFARFNPQRHIAFEVFSWVKVMFMYLEDYKRLLVALLLLGAAPLLLTLLLVGLVDVAALEFFLRGGRGGGCCLVSCLAGAEDCVCDYDCSVQSSYLFRHVRPVRPHYISNDDDAAIETLENAPADVQPIKPWADLGDRTVSPMDV
jgi:hypothetical protein